MVRKEGRVQGAGGKGENFIHNKCRGFKQGRIISGAVDLEIKIFSVKINKFSGSEPFFRGVPNPPCSLLPAPLLLWSGR